MLRRGRVFEAISNMANATTESKFKALELNKTKDLSRYKGPNREGMSEADWLDEMHTLCKDLLKAGM